MTRSAGATVFVFLLRGAAVLGIVLLLWPRLERLFQPLPAEDPLAEIAKEIEIPKLDPETLLAEFAVPHRDAVIAMLEQPTDEPLSQDQTEALRRHALTTVRAADTVYESPRATAELRSSAARVKLDVLFYAAELDPAAFDPPLRRMLEEVARYEDPNLALQAEVYLIIHQHLGRVGIEEGAIDTLSNFANRHPGEPMAADLFLSLAMKQESQGDGEGARATCERARILFSDDPRSAVFAHRLNTLAEESSIANAPTGKSTLERSGPSKSSLAKDKPAGKEGKKSSPSRTAISDAKLPKMHFSGPTLTGKTLTASQFKGKVVLVDFWATWCGPCKAELPHVKRVYDKFHRHGFEVVGISLDSDRSALASYVHQNRIPWQQIIFPNSREQGWQNPIAKQYGISSIPATFLLDRQGRVVAKNLRGVDAIERAVSEQLFGVGTAQVR